MTIEEATLKTEKMTMNNGETPLFRMSLEEMGRGEQPESKDPFDWGLPGQLSVKDVAIYVSFMYITVIFLIFKLVLACETPSYLISQKYFPVLNSEVDDNVFLMRHAKKSFLHSTCTAQESILFIKMLTFSNPNIL